MNSFVSDFNCFRLQCLLQTKAKYAQCGNLCEESAARIQRRYTGLNLNSTRPPLTWYPSHMEKRETRIFLWKLHTESAGLEPETHAWLARLTLMYELLALKESSNSKMRMPGTVKCRPTIAYWVQIDGINIATELITRKYSNETLIQCCFNVRPTSATLAKHWTNIG